MIPHRHPRKQPQRLRPLSYLEHDPDDVLPLLLWDVDDEPGAEVVQDGQRDRVRHGRTQRKNDAEREKEANDNFGSSANTNSPLDTKLRAFPGRLGLARS
jgi:hypothetical protein